MNYNHMKFFLKKKKKQFLSQAVITDVQVCHFYALLYPSILYLATAFPDFNFLLIIIYLTLAVRFFLIINFSIFNYSILRHVITRFITQLPIIVYKLPLATFKKYFLGCCTFLIPKKIIHTKTSTKMYKNLQCGE